MIYVQYKYTPHMFVIKKRLKKFLKDFFDKHFHDFLAGDIGLYISPEYQGSVSYVQLAFDLDSKFRGLMQVVKDAEQLTTLFKIPFEFVTSYSGLHIVSKIAFRQDITMVDLNHFLKSKMSKQFPSIDWNGSIRVTPFGRLGLIPERQTYMTPLKVISESEIKKKRVIRPGELMPEDAWIEYFQNDLFPQFDKTTSVKDFLDDVFGIS